jgi:hypothetical protein
MYEDDPQADFRDQWIVIEAHDPLEDRATRIIGSYASKTEADNFLMTIIDSFRGMYAGVFRVPAKTGLEFSLALMEGEV